VTGALAGAGERQIDCIFEGERSSGPVPLIELKITEHVAKPSLSSRRRRSSIGYSRGCETTLSAAPCSKAARE